MRLHHWIVFIATQLAVGPDPAARAFLQQRQVWHVEREAQVRMRAEPAVGFDTRGAELQAHVLQQPVVAGQGDAGMAVGVPAAHVAADLGDPRLQRAAGAEPLAIGRDPEIQASGDSRPQGGHVEAVHRAAQ